MSTTGGDNPYSGPADGVESVIDAGATRDGLRQLRRRWPVASPRASVLVVHGLGEHSGRYERLGRRFAASNLFTVAFDHRGFGASEGPRAHVERFSDFVDDVEDHMRQLVSLGMPTVLLGHSMGGLIALDYALTRSPRPDLVVLSAPALDAAAPRLLRRAAGPLAAVVPGLRLKSPFPTSMLSRDPAVAAAFESDPLVERRMSVRLGAELAAAMENTRSEVARLDVPTLLIHGDEDRLVPTGATEIASESASVERRVLRGLRHEPFNEPEGPSVMEDVIAWIEGSLGP